MNIRFEVMNLPCSIPAYVTEKTDSDGDYYTIFINDNCSKERIEKAIKHELSHINNNDFNSELNANIIEMLRHK